MRDFLSDLNIAWRRLRHAPGFALTAILSLTLAITANLVVFGVMNAAILRPLQVAHADRLWMIVQKAHGDVSQSYPDYLDYRTRNATFTDIGAYRFGEVGWGVQSQARKA